MQRVKIKWTARVIAGKSLLLGPDEVPANTNQKRFNSHKF